MFEVYEDFQYLKFHSSKENPSKRIFHDIYPGEVQVIKELFEKLVFPLYFKKFKNAI